jgi:DtxR family Mn-dependent transcriptional regulator
VWWAGSFPSARASFASGPAATNGAAPAISRLRENRLAKSKTQIDSRLSSVLGANVTEQLSDAIQDYLREIYKLESSGVRATTTSVAEALSVSAPSASVMLKRLAALDLVEHTPYRGVALTDAGRRVALEVIRHHRLLEQYLAETLGVPLDEVHGEADRLEHALSEELERRIDALLGHPTRDPHGHPIPDADLNVDALGARTLLELSPGERATVAHVPDGDVDLLRYLSGLELVPGREVELKELAPFEGPVMLRSANGEHAISREIAGAIGVT